MSFNFGATDFKHPPNPKGGYTAVCEAPKDCIAQSGVKGGGDKPQKIQNNAPQAVIIEVPGISSYWERRVKGMLWGYYTVLMVVWRGLLFVSFLSLGWDRRERG